MRMKPKIAVTKNLKFYKDQVKRLELLGDVTFHNNDPKSADEWFERCKDADIICTGIFGLKGISGVGISFGFDRIYLVMQELDLFKNTPELGPQLLFINFGEQEAQYVMKSMKLLRKQGVKSEMYPSSAKLKKRTVLEIIE